MSKKTAIQGPTWNLKLLYKSANDPQIEKDIRRIEATHWAFAKKYDTPTKRYLSDPKTLLSAIRDIERMRAFGEKPLHYFWYLRDLEAENKAALSNIPLLENRLTKAWNQTAFFNVLLGKISIKKQKEFLADKRLAPYKVLLRRIFDDSKHELSVAEEKIMSLKSQPAYDMWIAGNEKILNMQTVKWKGKALPMAQAMNAIRSLKTAAERSKLAGAISTVLRDAVAPFSESEINAVVTNKKINDELRGFKTPYEATVTGYRNDPAVVEALVKTVTDGFRIAHRFYRIKARLLKQKRLSYSDRSAKIGSISAKYPFNKSIKKLKEVLKPLGSKYPKMLDDYIGSGQIDAHPRIGKTGGAYCSGSYGLPTFVLLNHVGDLNSYTTLAHEMGHAFHTELSKKKGPLYFHYSTSLAETASTLFESIALEAVFDDLPDNEKVVALHDQINDAISTVFRQIACFNYENEIHATIRSKGYMSKEELANVHNKNMSAYLGPIFELKHDDGYLFTQWSHIRRFFYVYSYAYGMLVSQALLRRYRTDPKFWSEIEKFLSAGGSDTPENILKGIGLNVSSPEFWKEGLTGIEEKIAKLDRLTR